MRYPAAEKAEIIKLVEQSHLSARQTLDRIGVSRSTFYRWYDLYQMGGPDALEDKPSKPSRVWNRIPQPIHDQIIEMALEESELSPRELAVRFTETRDRQRKLISKIDSALKRIDDGSYGYCEETGEPIGLARLDARPIATLSLEAQELHERREKVYRDD